jgi:hypothetical protein
MASRIGPEAFAALKRGLAHWAKAPGWREWARTFLEIQRGRMT